MVLGPGRSIVASAATYTISTRCGGAVSLRRAPRGSTVQRHRRRRRIPRAQVLKVFISTAATGVVVAKSKQQWSLPTVRGTIHAFYIGPQQAANACLMLRPDAPAGRGYRQRSWGGSDAPRGRPYRAVWSAQIARALRVFSRVGSVPAVPHCDRCCSAYGCLWCTWARLGSSMGPIGQPVLSRRVSARSLAAGRRSGTNGSYLRS